MRKKKRLIHHEFQNSLKAYLLQGVLSSTVKAKVLVPCF